MATDRFYSLVILALLLASCGMSMPGIKTPSPVITPTLPVVPSITQHSGPYPPTAEEKPTLLPSLSPSPTPTITWTPTPGLVTQSCLEIRDRAPLWAVANGGTIIPHDLDPRTALWNLETQEWYPLYLNAENSRVEGVIVSPNGQMLAYGDTNEATGKRRLTIANAEGKVKASILLRNRTGIERWLDNERIALEWDGDPPWSMPGGTIVVNPFTGTQQVVAPTFPDPYDNSLGIVAFWSVMYSPDLEWVVYLDQHFSVVVWDVIGNKLLWEKTGENNKNPPQWSPAGDQVAVRGYDDGELYRINRQGEVKTLPDLGNPSWGAVLQFEWSPDGRHIAFWVKTGEEDKARLLILDTHTEKVSDYCLETDLTGSIITWSPDSQQVIVHVFDKNPDNSFSLRTILIDKTKNTATLIPDEMTPIIWMKSLP